MGQSEQEIIDNLLSIHHRRKGEEQIFNSYSYFIREGMRKYSLSDDEAFDAYSDTIIAAISKIANKTFEGRSSLKTFVYQIFRNKCVDLLRKKATNKHSIHRTVSLSDLLTDISDAAKSIIQKIMERSDLDLLRVKLNELGENCKKLLMSSADGYTDKEIAVLLEYKNADVVKVSRLRCLEKLRQLYKSSK